MTAVSLENSSGFIGNHMTCLFFFNSHVETVAIDMTRIAMSRTPEED